MVREERLVVIKILRDRVGGHTVIVAVELESRQPPFRQLTLEPACLLAEIGDVEHQPSRTSRCASSPDQLKNTSGGSEPTSATWIVVFAGFVRKILDDDVDVGMGLLEFFRREFQEGRVAFGLQHPLLDGDGLGRRGRVNAVAAKADDRKAE